MKIFKCKFKLFCDPERKVFWVATHCLRTPVLSKRSRVSQKPYVTSHQWDLEVVCRVFAT